MPRGILTTLRAGSLINDGTALVLFAVTVGVVGGAVILIRKHVDDPLREGGVSILTPFVAFLLAELVHASGVLAVVVAGLLLSYAGPRVITAASSCCSVCRCHAPCGHQPLADRVAGHRGPPDVVDRFCSDYQEHLDDIRSPHTEQTEQEREIGRRLHLGVLEHKRREITRLRDRNEIDDAVQRQVQGAIDIAEIQLLGPEPED